MTCRRPRPRRFAVLAWVVSASICLATSCDSSCTSCTSSEETHREEARCRELAGPPGFAVYEGVRILEGSEVRGSRVIPGEQAPCEGRAARTLVAIAGARARVPEGLRRDFDVHLDASGDHRPDGAETLIESGALLVDGRTGPGLDESIWLHELMHVAAAGARPVDPIGARLIAAVDEASADYGAAAVLGGSLVGPRGGAGTRDLSAAGTLPPAAFHALAMGDGFDAHGFGLPLAAALWQREPRAGALVEDLALALAGEDGVPWPSGAGARSAVAALISRCPERSRRLLVEAIAEWLPEELRP